MTRKKIILIIIIICIVLCLISFLIIIISDLNRLHRQADKFETSYEMSHKDSLCFNNLALNDIKLVYSKSNSNLCKFSYYSYKKNYKLIVRNLSDERNNFRINYKIVFGDNNVDIGAWYSIEDVMPFNYKICVDRTHKVNKNFIIDGEEIKVSKSNKDTLQLHGKFYNISIGRQNSYVNEGIYMQNELLFRSPIEMDILLINQKNGLNLYMIFSNDESSKIPNGITLELI